MNTILFVVGEPGTGKSTFIHKKFSKNSKYYVMDLSAISLELFDTYDALEDDRIVHIYNEANEQGTQALMDGRILVVEYCLGISDNDDFLDLITEAKKSGFRVEMVQLSVENGEREKRLRLASEETTYYPSSSLAEDVLVILEGIVECAGMNVEMEQIGQIAMDEKVLRLYRSIEDSRPFFFYISDDVSYFDFQEEEDEEFPEVESLVKFDSFEKMIKGLKSEFKGKVLRSTRVNSEFEKPFNLVFHNSVENLETPFDISDLGKSLN